MADSFNYPIHAFRGFAIINIVAIHAFSFVLFYASQAENPAGTALGIFGALNSILLHDSTLYFTFISGILFSMILQERGYARFYKSKFNYVFLPYLFFTLLYSARTMAGPPGTRNTLFEGTPLEFLQLAGTNLLNGHAVLIFWYIPVLITLYAVTPLLARLTTYGRWNWIAALIILAPLVCSRVWPQVSWTNYVYFLGAYLIGLIAGAHYQKTRLLIEQHKTTLIAVAIISSLAFFVLWHFKVPTFGFTNLEESAWYIQKIAMSALVLLLFEKTMTRVPRWLDVLGEYAFALYFMHMIFVIEFTSYISRAGISLDSGPAILLAMAAVFFGAMAASTLLIFIVRAVLGKRSRYLIGA